MIKKIITLIVFMAWVSVVNATFINRGNHFTDTKPGLDWLKLTETMEMYVVQVENEMVPGARLDGWRYATIDDLRILISKGGSNMKCNT